MITIIGAGPIGSYTAYLLAKQGKEVNLFEEHKSIGSPVHCTGLTTSGIKDIIPVNNEFILDKISKAKIFSPDKKFVEINFKEKNIVLDRNKFDNYIADTAKDNGANLYLNHRFIDNKKSVAIIKDNKKNTIKKINFDCLIGADGPLSQVAKSNYMFSKREFWQGIQARVNIKNDNSIEFYPYFGTYAWVVPENEETVRIGLVSKNYANVLFKNFLFKFKGIKDDKIIEYQGGLIPNYNPRINTQRNNIYIVGDAACQVKATTGGGIIPGLSASKILADSIINHKNYDRHWKKEIGRNLYFHLFARRIMDKFRDKDWNKLIEIMGSKETSKILEEKDRENMLKILIGLVIKKPSLLYFFKCLL